MSLLKIKSNKNAEKSRNMRFYERRSGREEEIESPSAVLQDCVWWRTKRINRWLNKKKRVSMKNIKKFLRK
jgi:hypothetical protein